MTDQACEKYSRQYAQFLCKEVVKASAAAIFDDLRATFSAHLRDNPGQPGPELGRAVMDLLSDVECRYYNTFNLQENFDEVLER